jgi:hypothetical protein
MTRERRVVVVMAVIFAILMGLEVAAQAAARRAAEADTRPWTGAIERMDRALAANNVSAAERATHEAYVMALSSRRWESMVAVGDAYTRLADATGYRTAGRAKARQAYLTAFFRARAEQSIDGVLRTTEAFSDLGDRAVAAQCLKTAEALAAKSKHPGVRDRVAALAERLDARGVAALPAAAGF